MLCKSDYSWNTDLWRLQYASVSLLDRTIKMFTRFSNKTFYIFLHTFISPHENNLQKRKRKRKETIFSIVLTQFRSKKGLTKSYVIIILSMVKFLQEKFLFYAILREYWWIMRTRLSRRRTSWLLPYPHPPFPIVSCLSLLFFLRVAGRAWVGGGGGVWRGG